VEDSYDVSVTVYDLGWQDGDITRFEEIVAPEESHATLSFPIHTMWAEDPMCLDASGVPVPAEGVDIVRDPTCEPLTAEEYYCSGECAVDAELADFLCDGESLIVEALYPPC
jgi:hypothetical protein